MSTPDLQSLDKARKMREASAHVIHEHTSANNYETFRIRPAWRQRGGAAADEGAGIASRMREFDREGHVVTEVSGVDVIGAEGLFGDELVDAVAEGGHGTGASVPNTRLLSAYCVTNCECWHLSNEAFGKVLLAKHTHAKNVLGTSAFTGRNQRMAVARVVRNHQRRAENMAERVYRVQLDHIRRYSNFTLNSGAAARRGAGAGGGDGGPS